MKFHTMFQYLRCPTFAAFLVTSTLLVFTISGASDEELSPIKKTTSGKIQGYVHTLKDGRRVERYLGIPYATPPVGDRRFELPVPPETWAGVLKTISVPATCMQNHLEQAYIKVHAPDYSGSMSEDCLYLNIYVPQRHGGTLQLLPVLVHVHGGSNEVGMGAMLHGDVLASHGQIVVVTFNYRLAAFGFFHAPQLDIRDNLGLYDQVLVFKWIQQNIGQFGGDPSKVTIQGHSAGSVDVGMHVLSPASIGLFRYAILQSGAPTSYWSVLPDDDLNDPTKGPVHHVRDLGCDLEDKQLAVSCLKDVNATRLATKVYNHGDGVYAFAAAVDRFFLLDQPLKLLDRLAQGRTGILNAEALLLGVVKNEGAHSANQVRQQDLGQKVEETSEYSNATQMPDMFDDQNFKVFPETILSQYKKTDTFEDLTYFVYKPWSDPKNVTANFMGLSDLVGDVTFTAPTIQTADYLSKSNRTQVYVYSFEHRSQMSIYPEWMGVPHGDDIFYLFGCPIEGHPLRNYTVLDRSVSLALIHMWAHFITHGRPSLGQENSSSKAYGEEQNYILINSNETDVVIRHERRMRARYMAFWNNLTTMVNKSESKTSNRSDRQETITWILVALLCVVSVVSLAAILFLCRKTRLQRLNVKQTCKF